MIAEILVRRRLHICWCSSVLQGLSIAIIEKEKIDYEMKFKSLALQIEQVERGKQAYYCYDDAELKSLQSSFPPNASYNIQRFKGKTLS